MFKLSDFYGKTANHGRLWENRNFSVLLFTVLLSINEKIPLTPTFNKEHICCFFLYKLSLRTGGGS